MADVTLPGALRTDQRWLRASLRQCARSIGHVPELSEYLSWRADHNRHDRPGGLPRVPVPDELVYIERYGDWATALADAELYTVAV